VDFQGQNETDAAGRFLLRRSEGRARVGPWQGRTGDPGRRCRLPVRGGM